MRIFGVIPARYGSSRFPGKPLAMIHGKSMIQRVYEQAQKAEELSGLVVATDDERIAQAVKDFGGEVVMTQNTHQSGTDRCQEAVVKLGKSVGAVVNIQGDEPFIQAEQINQVAALLKQGAPIATLVKPISSTSTLLDPNKVKAILNKNNQAIYFSRSPIPFFKNKTAEHWLSEHQYYKHLGIYGYRSDILHEISHLEQSSLEIAESLEQLRWIENGYAIHVGITRFESPSIDTPEDLAKVLREMPQD